MISEIFRISQIPNEYQIVVNRPASNTMSPKIIRGVHSDGGDGAVYLPVDTDPENIIYRHIIIIN